MYKRKVLINEENDYLDLVQAAIINDFNALIEKKKIEVHIKFIQHNDEMTVLLYSEKSYQKDVDEFVEWIELHYNHDD